MRIEERVPREQDLDAQSVQQWNIHGVDTSNYHSTAAMRAARAYPDVIGQIYILRLERPSHFHETPDGYSEH